MSPKIIPQMADTADVIRGIKLDVNSPKLLTIVANERGAEMASGLMKLLILDFPFLYLKLFNKKHQFFYYRFFTAFENIQNICVKRNKLIYFSWRLATHMVMNKVYIVAHWAQKLLNDFGIKILLAIQLGPANHN